MRAPPARPASNAAPLGTLQPIAVPARSEAASSAPAAVSPAEPAPVAPIRIASSPAPQPYPLHERDLALPSGAVIHHVPRGVAVRTVAEAGSEERVYEFVDARGRRLALLKETALGRVALGSGPPLLEATAATHVEAQRDDWAKARVNVVVDRFQSDTRLYTLERRSSGTDWIMSGLELGSHR